jgi:hypothetical protein
VSQIKVGDLVIVIAGCCSTTQQHIGHIDTVRRMHSRPARCVCGYVAQPVLAVITDPMGECGVPLSWLKRIPPLEELDDVKRHEEIEA